MTLLVKIGNMIIEPQAGDYYFADGSWPQRVGDQCYINPSPPNFGVYPSRRVLVILLADASGRQWLVECK